MAVPIVDIDKRIDQYVKLRDHIKELNDAHKEKMAPFNDTLEQLNGVLLKHLEQMNIESLKGEHGTVYVTVKKSASIADMSQFWTYVVTQVDWDMVDRKANATAVEAYIEANGGNPPPGVNFSAVRVVGVRRK